MNMILGKMMPVFAQAGQGQPGPQFWTQLPILGLLVVIFYFALIRPQQKKAKEQAETDAILAALNSTRWNRKQAAQILNIDYKALLYRMKKLSIEN